MTPILRAGVGGLAASLRAIHKAHGSTAKWEAGVQVILGPGKARVEAHQITLEWPEGGLEGTLGALWQGAFQVSQGVIYLPGAHREGFDGTQMVPVRLQEGMKNTFLQHGKSTEKTGAEKILTIDHGEGPITIQFQPYASYAHVKAIEDLLDGLRKRNTVELPGWACPGAAQRHVAYANTRTDYPPTEALAALFSLVGCISLPCELGGGGFLVIPEPSDLISYAKFLPSLNPGSIPDTAPSSLGDAVLLAEMSMLLENMDRPCAASFQGTWLKAMAWDKKQKYRSALVEVGILSEETRNAYEILRSTIPPRFIATKAGTTWVRPSHFRAFASDNLVRGRPWYEGFSTHSITESKKARFLHTYWASDKGNLGALQFSEKEGLTRMTEQLAGNERLLVEATHEAIRCLFGQIYSNYTALGGDLKKRYKDERQRIRLAFTSAKTQDQVRSAFAELWSRAGSIPTLKDHWSEIMALVNGPKWMLTRDLALVALASYKGRTKEEEETPEDSEHSQSANDSAEVTQ